MRGKRSRRRCPTSSPRIIPAHAGQTSCRNCGTHNHPDHPRACGANTIAFGEFFVGSGSSPRMRGKQTGSPDLADSVLLAYYKPLQLPSDHPRACGANSALRPSNILQSGSSPRMRGKRRCQLSQMARDRIIPAHAGQTCGGRRGPACSADHPRACGANIGVDVSDAFGCGSSPRMRGKLPCARSGRRLRRIIPAHAGQTTS